MKKLLTLVTASLVAAAVGHASSDIHHQLVINGTFRTAVAATSGTTQVTNVVSVAITNADLIKPFVTGSTPAKDFDIAIDDQTAEIDIIRKPATTSGTATVVKVIGNAVDYNANTLSELHSTNPKHLGGYEVINDYAISLPTGFYSADFDDSTEANVSLYLTLGHNKTDANEFADILSGQFAGGANEGQANAYIIDGNASTTSKSYTY